jgi:hypothetical protein
VTIRQEHQPDASPSPNYVFELEGQDEHRFHSAGTTGGIADLASAVVAHIRPVKEDLILEVIEAGGIRSYSAHLPGHHHLREIFGGSFC